MSPGLLGSTVDSVTRTGAEETDVNDWKLGQLPGMLPSAWDDQEARTPQGPRRWRSALRDGIAAVRRLMATNAPASGEALAHGDRGDLNPG
jgi:hypothetical protein